MGYNKDEEKRFRCETNCDANMGGVCMWKIDAQLIELAKDKNYRMCEKLRKECEKYM